MDSNNILSLLGLALRGHNLVVGEEPVEAEARAKDARLLLLASDAADNTRRRVEHFALAGQCIWLQLPFTKAELGRAVGRPSTAIVAVTDIGLAAAVAHRLAELDPARYEEAAQRLDLKAQRAMERKAEMAAHEKNVRMGKYQAEKKAKAAESEKAAQQTPKKAAPAQQSRKDGKPRASRPSRPSRENRPKPKTKVDRFAHSRPVKKGKGSVKKKSENG